MFRYGLFRVRGDNGFGRGLMVIEERDVESMIVVIGL